MRRVISDPARLAFLSRGGLDGLFDLRRFLVHVVPLARRALLRLESLADRIPDERLRAQAFSSLHNKAYHVAGACILSTFLPSGARQHYVEIVAPLETIYDFLDCLCDRHPDTTPAAYRQLHEAIADALDPARPIHEYYAFGPPGDDGDYLATLVRHTRRALRRLGDYELLLPVFRRAAALYADMQTFTHLPAADRDAACVAWHEKSASGAGLSWWEFAAAAGSQFHVYAPLYEAFCSDFDAIRPAYDAYFPAVCALHVLLDSFIDRAEDAAHGDLSLVGRYDSHAAFVRRAAELAAQARAGFAHLGMPRAHEFALRTMALFYLTHPKVARYGMEREATALLRALS